MPRRYQHSDPQKADNSTEFGALRTTQSGQSFEPTAATDNPANSGSIVRLQRTLGNQALQRMLHIHPAPTHTPIQRFGSEEHAEIGNRALPGQMVDIGGEIGEITYGEMIAMAGDYFENVEQIRRLAADWMNADQVRYVLWKVNPSRPRPVVSQNVENAVNDRYLRLAGNNEDHFSTGSAPGNNNRERYIALHQDAIRAAYSQGSTGIQTNSSWQAREAYSNHYLTDAFSAGHIRTPRGDIKRHWESLYPNFINDTVRTISAHMAVYINDHDNVGWVKTVDGLTDAIVPEVQRMGGAALRSFAIGDLISKLLHDADNAGLDVISDASATSTGEHSWRAVGDDHLFPGTPNPAASETQAMVQQAVQFSFEEAQQAYRAGASHTGDLTAMTESSMFRALPLFPREDTTSSTNEAFGWRVASIADLPANIVGLINGAFASGGEIRRELDAMAIPATMERSGFTLSTGAAFNSFKTRLLADPMGMITRIANGQHMPQ